PRFDPPQYLFVPREELAKLRSDIGSLLLGQPFECTRALNRRFPSALRDQGMDKKPRSTIDRPRPTRRSRTRRLERRHSMRPSPFTTKKPRAASVRGLRDSRPDFLDRTALSRFAAARRVGHRLCDLDDELPVGLQFVGSL